MNIGVSGHQDLGSTERVIWIKHQLTDQLERMHFASGISSLAAGADQLFATIVLDLGHDVEVIIPCEQYESAFESPEAKKEFQRLKNRAKRCYFLDFPAPSEQAFFAAGRRVVEMSDLLFAVWDGEPAAGLGGTADVVNHALRSGKKVFQINPVNLTTHFVKPK